MVLRLLLFIVHVYQYCVSPCLAPNCRFLPSCSCYAEQALCRYGVVKGCCFIFLRLIRCHPWGGSGYDPLP